jgi:hypothetical protein
MKEIPLTQGKFALIDDEDFWDIIKYHWSAVEDKTRDVWYAVRQYNKKSVYMHRHILGITNKLKTDHIDGNGLNNQKYNIRACTDSQNQMNVNKRIENSSKYKGVSYHKKWNKWVANIRIHGKRIYLGGFISEIEAAQIYNQKALELFGNFAKINDIGD